MKRAVLFLAITGAALAQYASPPPVGGSNGVGNVTAAGSFTPGNLVNANATDGKSVVDSGIPFNKLEKTFQTATYAAGSTSGGLKEAYAAAVAAGGGKVVLSSAITISAANTLTLMSASPITVDFAGNIATCTLTSGICLELSQSGGNVGQQRWTGGTITCSGTCAGVTAVKFTNVVQAFNWNNMLIQNFSGSGSWGMLFSNSELVSIDGSSAIMNCANGVEIAAASTTLQFFRLTLEFIPGVPMRIDDGAVGIFCASCLFQGNLGTHQIEIVSSSLGVNNITFDAAHFEGNGDTTAASRVFFINANGARITNIIVRDSFFSAGSAGALATLYEMTGASGISAFHSSGNRYNGYAAAITGLSAFPITSEADFFSGLGFPEWCDVCINMGTQTGLFWYPQSGAHKFQMYAGDSANIGGGQDWFFTDLTTGLVLMKANHSTAQLEFTKYGTITNCSSSASPAVCAAAAGGSAVIAASATTVIVNTTAVSANSQIQITADQSLGTKLTVTCNTQGLTTLGAPRVAARVPATSFTVAIDVAPTTNPLCFSYSITN